MRDSRSSAASLFCSTTSFQRARICIVTTSINTKYCTLQPPPAALSPHFRKLTRGIASTTDTLADVHGEEMGRSPYGSAAPPPAASKMADGANGGNSVSNTRLYLGNLPRNGMLSSLG